jgi:hypothetical protein
MRFALWINLILFYIIFHFIFTCCYTQINEGFTPSIRKMYRPYIRQARLHSEGFIHRGKNHTTRLFKQFGFF